ncbi:MAG: DNA cytosine methyltransferase [Candidatus Bathyarchaeia archaeon]
MERRPKSIELFAGAGGLALGLEAAGFSTTALVEIDKYCCQTLRRNAPKYFPDAKVFRRDITKLDVSKVLKSIRLEKEQIDLIAGGPPCQSFTIAKIPKGGRSVDDPRDNLFLHFRRFVREIRPRAFLMENVPGLLNKAGGEVFQRVLDAFSSLDYKVNPQILNSANYGVPQIRKRLFLLGSRDGLLLRFPEPTYSPVHNLLGLPLYVTIRQAFSKLTPDMPNQDMPRHTEKKKKKLASLAPGSAWKNWRFRDDLDKPSRCITGHCRDDWTHPSEPRTGTVREVATLQSFPTDYVFCGPIMALNYVKFQFQYRQVGNAVPVLLAKAIGDSILKQVGSAEIEMKQTQ